MISKSLEGIINDQIRKEFYSGYFYLSMEAYLASLNLNGFANYFRVQAQEEKDHAMIFFNYLNHVGGRVNLQPIDGPQTEFDSPEEVFRLAYEHEQMVTKSIYNIVNMATEEKDHKTIAFLQWFVTEQTEEEANMEKYLRKLNLLKNDPRGLLMVDAELAQRVYTPAVNPALPAQV